MNATIYKKKKPLIVFLLPAVLFMVVFLYYPFVQNIINSSLEIQGLGRAATGMHSPWYANYVELFQDHKMWIAVKNTLILMVCTIIFQVGLALVLALMVDNIRRGQKVFQVVYFFPIIISATALGLLFNLMFLYDGGMVNGLLSAITGHEVMIDWKDETHWIFTMFMPVIWQYVGYYFVVLVTGLNNISPDLYEAGVIDGTNRWQRVRYITLPLLRNTLCTCLVLAITGALKVFDLPWTMFPTGMPVDESWLTGTYMYHVTFNASNVDYGCAISVIIVVLGVVFSKIANTAFKEKEY